ncbi:MAG: hypothetical protein HZB23_08115 [Deltaproteobacteria bacterium]|nr:hypothetical protein [Deltaproteobacteria bacterium]
MNFKIEHPCPQCQAPVILDETDRMLICPACRVRVHITSRGPFRYYMEAPEGSGDFLYLPYWRLKGTVYKAVSSFKIDPVSLDSAHVGLKGAFALKDLPNNTKSPQLRFAERGVAGRFVPPELDLFQVLGKMDKAASGLKETASGPETYENAWVGESAGVIFAPYALDGGNVVDLINKKPVGPAPEQAAIDALAGAATDELHWMPRFLSSMCPQCGFDLKGDKTAEVFLCKVCNMGWYPRGDEFRPILVRTIPGKGNDLVYLPFWCIGSSIKGVKLDTYADLIRVANLPKAIKKEWETDDFYFWIPAFKIHPHLFLRVAKQVTITPFLGAMEARVPDSGSLLPVNFPLVEAMQSLKSVLATFGTPKRTIFLKLPEISITPKKGMLVYVPCTPRGGELVQEELGIAVSKQALIYGKDV